MEFQKGDEVIHPAHGEGVVRHVSPEGMFAVVKYPWPDGKKDTHYFRTHSVNNLKKKEN